MGTPTLLRRIPLFLVFVLSALHQCCADGLEENQSVSLYVNAAEAYGKKIPKTMFGIFFEEINHAGAGGLWAELVSNRGFEAGGQSVPSNIQPWSVIGGEATVFVSTDRTSRFERNKIALRMEVLCDQQGSNVCPDGGVGVYNPGFWGMNIEQGKTYKLVLYVRSSGPIDVSVSLVGSGGSKLAATKIASADVSNWSKIEAVLKAKGSDAKARLQLTTTKKGVIWFDQVSLMPTDTYKGHGFRKDLFNMTKALKPGFLRFPGGCFVEGAVLRNAFRWKETIGPWEERPGHYGDVWNYWTDDGMGHFEFLQLAEDLGTLPIWVFNNGISHHEQVDTSDVYPFVREILDGLEFALGDSHSKWGSVRASLGHPEPFDLRYVAIGNEDCAKKNYQGNYLKFYSAIKRAYPDIKIISNCDGSSKPLDHPADFYDYHIYGNASHVFSTARKFYKAPRTGPKAFVSEYAVIGKNAGNGTLLAAIAEAAFLIGLENNCDAVEMASYAPLFVHTNDRKWKPDAIVFDSSQAYGTPSYWMQHFFRESNGATLVNSSFQYNPSNSLMSSAIIWKDAKAQKHLKIKVVNFGNDAVNLQISIKGLGLQSSGWTKTELTSANVMDENSFQVQNKVTPVATRLKNARQKMEIALSPRSLTSIDLLISSNSNKIVES